MDCALSPMFDEPDEPLTPGRSPSRLDFCTRDLDDRPMHQTDWACTSSCPYTFIDEDVFAVDIAPLDLPRPLNMDSPPAADPDTHESTGPPASPEHAVIIEPRAPTPLRPLSVQLQVESRESMPPPPLPSRQQRTATQRLNYPHHGFSRSALLQQKTLWNSRYEEWAEWQSRLERDGVHSVENDAYTGLASVKQSDMQSPPPCMRTPPSGLERDLVDHPPRTREQDVRSSIHPRVGDISALRDPYTVNIDRCFFRYPLWTLHKTLYVFTMHQESGTHAPSAPAYHNTAQVQASRSSSMTLSSYTSSSSADEESDSTLAADDSHGQRFLEPLNCDSTPQSPPLWSRLCDWDLSWYTRWELLIGLLQRDNIKYDAFDMSTKLAASLESKTSVLRFTVGEENEDDVDDDEDEDYGTLVQNSSLCIDFDEECKRALAFYGRDSSK